MVDFKYIPIPNFPVGVVNAPRRAKRPHIESGRKCVFCPGGEKQDPDVFRIPARNASQSEAGGGGEDQDRNWQVRAVPNKYPFAPIHEVVVLTPEHTKHLSSLSVEQVRLGIEAFVSRYNSLKDKGTVCIFGNSGKEAGESIGHPHAQIAVVGDDVPVVVPRLEKDPEYRGETFEVEDFEIICPPYSQWPDEVWIVPKERGKEFGDITYKEIESLAIAWNTLIKIFELRHNRNFPHNFYIYPFKDWYLRIIPRKKSIGGFELETGIFVNTQDPHETMQFIKDHYEEQSEEKIKKARASYRRGV
ncbi:MAG: hypothetical protein ACM3IJ_05670 [Candidatus Levyibacteriota bacterium]